MKYTLIFIFYKNKVLLLNRKNSPCMGLWCGVGGHIEMDESAEECAYRELEEETGIKNVKLKHEFTYQKIDSEVFYGVIPNCNEIAYGKNDNFEGLLCLFDIPWALKKENMGVNIETKHAITQCLFALTGGNNGR